jgi:hypothetical protein
MKTKIFLTFSMMVFLLGVLAFATGKQKHSTTNSEITSREISRLLREAIPPRAFKATQIETYVSVDGEETVSNIRICNVKEDGSWIEVWKAVGHEWESTHTGNPQTGEYTSSVGKESINMPNTNRGTNLALYRSKEYLMRANEGAQKKTEKIAGLEAVVSHEESTEIPGHWIESAHAPETGPFWLRMIYHQPDGSEVRIETVRVVFK